MTDLQFRICNLKYQSYKYFSIYLYSYTSINTKILSLSFSFCRSISVHLVMFQLCIHCNAYVFIHIEFRITYSCFSFLIFSAFSISFNLSLSVFTCIFFSFFTCYYYYYFPETSLSCTLCYAAPLKPCFYTYTHKCCVVRFKVNVYFPIQVLW